MSTKQLLFKLPVLFAAIHFSESFFQPYGLLPQSKTFSFITVRLLAETNINENNNDKKKVQNGRRKKKKIVINTSLMGVENVESDGNLAEQKKQQKEAQKSRDAVESNLGKTSKKKKADDGKKKLSKKAQKLVDQRTAMGTVDGTLQAGLALPEDQQIQIQEVKRGNKQVTIVR